MSELAWILALAIGFLAAWYIQAYRLKAIYTPSEEERAERDRVVHEKVALEERCGALEKSLGEAKDALSQQQDENKSLHGKLSASEERIRSMETRIAEQKKELEEVHKRLTAEFETLANRVLEKNTEKFVANNKESLDKLLLPLSEKIVSFRERVEKTHDQGVKDRAALAEQLKTLGDLNQRMSDEARNLTTALKGQTKTQGNWGELILETVLEKSGLVAGQEYETQVSLQNEEGKRLQPDVLIKLPDGKHLVVDSKVSLVAYERSVNAEDDSDRLAALKEHVASVKAHVSELSKKRYDAIYDIQSPDFTLMFVPVEPAFSLAMQSDESLFDFAFQQNVVLVTPTTLLATLRTVANIWRQEKQTRHALDIAQRSGALYDKFVGYYKDMETIGDRIRQTGEAYEAAMSKLKTGRGNLVNQVQTLKQLGAKAKKSLPEEALEAASDVSALDE